MPSASHRQASAAPFRDGGPQPPQLRLTVLLACLKMGLGKPKRLFPPQARTGRPDRADRLLHSRQSDGGDTVQDLDLSTIWGRAIHYICIYCSNVPAECTCDTGDGDPGSASTAPRLCGPRSSRDLIRPGDGDGGRNRPECPRCGPVISERCKVCADRFDRDMREAMRRQSRLADAKDGGVPPKAPPRLFRRLVASDIPSAQPTRPVGAPRTRLRDEPSSSTKPQGSWV